jgi:hypothetical protein
MIGDRWHATRARLLQDASEGEASGLWNRIASSRSAGVSVELPARDPRRPVSPILLAVAVASVVLGITMRSSPAPVTAEPTAADSEVAVMDSLTTPAHAQGNGVSTLPPVDGLDLSRLVPGRLVYQNAEGADGIIVQQSGTDTIHIARDTVDGVARLILVRPEGQGRKNSGTSGLRFVDSLALSLDGKLLFWHWQMQNLHVPSHSITMSTALLPDSLRFTSQRLVDPAPTIKTRSAVNGYPGGSPLLALLPALPLERGYARSVSVLDLLGGQTTPALTRSVELRVTAKEWVTVPAGRFLCWVVEYSRVPEPGAKRFISLLYVDIASGVLVRAEWTPEGTFSGEQILIERQFGN